MPTGISLHFAVPTPGGDCCRQKRLPGAPRDAESLAELARAAKFWVRDPLVDDRVTKDVVLAALRGAAAELVAGDLLLVTFSGHGCQIPDLGGFEPIPEYGYDESWCLADQQLVDDDVHPVLAAFADGVRILVISDSCYSETVVAIPASIGSPADASLASRRLPLIQDRAKSWGISAGLMNLVLPRRADRVEIKASVILLGSCREAERGLVRGNNSLFVEKLMAVWDDGRFAMDGTYESFIGEVCDQVATVNPYQHPGIARFGTLSDTFLRQRPFTI